MAGDYVGLSRATLFAQPQGFEWKGKMYMYKYPGISAYPFGLSSALRVFTKLLKLILAWLRQRGVHMIVYISGQHPCFGILPKRRKGKC